MVTAGLKRNRVTLQKRTDTLDAAGQPQPVWVDQFCRWARVTPLRGEERIQAMQLDATLTDRVELYWDSETKTITAGEWRVQYGTRNLDVNSVINVRETNQAIELHCTEAV